LTGCSLQIFWPIVFTIRQPPMSVPRPIAAWHARTTHNGGSVCVAGIAPDAISTTKMMPIVFCASLPPWPRL
jgi:hypothetical protein